MKNFLKRLFGNSPPDLVPYYDFDTKTRVLIPRSELSPGAVLVQIQGESEPIYADSSSLKIGAYQHDSLPPDVMVAIAEFVNELADVRPMTQDEWIDGFRRDANPDREVAGWWHLSKILRVMTDRHQYSAPQRAEGFRILVACFTGARDTVRERSDPELLPADQVEQTIQYFYEGGY